MPVIGRTACLILVLTLGACSFFQGRQSTMQAVDDSTITTQVKMALAGDDKVSAAQVDVTTMQGVVMLSGFTDSAAAEAQAVQLAQNVDGVKAVKDTIVLRTVHKNAS